MLNEFSNEDYRYLRAIESIADSFEKMAQSLEEISKKLDKKESEISNFQTTNFLKQEQEKKQEKFSKPILKYWQCQDCGKRYSSNNKPSYCFHCGSPAIYENYNSDFPEDFNGFNDDDS